MATVYLPNTPNNGRYNGTGTPSTNGNAPSDTIVVGSHVGTLWATVNTGSGNFQYSWSPLSAADAAVVWKADTRGAMTAPDERQYVGPPVRVRFVDGSTDTNAPSTYSVILRQPVPA